MNNIRTYNCETCNINIKVNLNDKNKYLYYFFCCDCLKNISVCSKKNCEKLFLLNNNELKNIKTIYLFNSNNKFYIYDDIKPIVINKYGSFDNLKKILKERKINKKNKLCKLENEKKKREIELKELFALNKLDFKNYGDCYSYIHYNKPDLNTVLNNELDKLKVCSMKQFIMANELDDDNITLDEKVKSCYNYINSLKYNPFININKSIQNDMQFNNNEYHLYENNTQQNNNICV